MRTSQKLQQQPFRERLILALTGFILNYRGTYLFVGTF